MVEWPFTPIFPERTIMETTYFARNFRPNLNKVRLDGSGEPHIGHIIADLYDKHGKFYRCAVVADCGDNSLEAKQYCIKQNFVNRDCNPYCDLPFNFNFLNKDN